MIKITKFKYCCTCPTTKTGVTGNGETTMDISSEDFRRDLILKVAEMSVEDHIRWDPFNVNLIVKAQDEPKH